MVHKGNPASGIVCPLARRTPGADALDVTFVQGPLSVIISTVVASATTTGECVQDMLFLPLVPLQRGCWCRRRHGPQARADAAAEIGQDGGGWQVTLCDENRGASRAGLQTIRGVDEKEVP
jgi:hypothetical protein